MQNSFSHERFRTWTRFETEAQRNSEMAYCVYLASAPVKFTLLLVHESNFCAAWYFTSFLSSIIRLKALHHALSTKKRRVLFSPIQYKTNSRNSSNLRTGSDGVIK